MSHADLIDPKTFLFSAKFLHPNGKTIPLRLGDNHKKIENKNYWSSNYTINDHGFKCNHLTGIIIRILSRLRNQVGGCNRSQHCTRHRLRLSEGRQIKWTGIKGARVQRTTQLFATDR